MIKGSPTVKYSFLVLCLSKYIATIPPIEPPTKDRPRSVTILILDLRSIAAILSMANAAKVTKLIMTKYANSILCSSKNDQNANVIWSA